jgi:addiction module HigA family antidote
MSNYIEYGGKVAFHPGYYIEEMIDCLGISQEDFAKRLGTTPKNLSILVRGEQSLSLDIAIKLSRMLGNSIEFWLAIQKRFDERKGEILSDEELEKEKAIFKLIDYKYLEKYFGLPASRKIDERIKSVREFLSVSSLCLLERQDLCTNPGTMTAHLNQEEMVNANVMMQIAVNLAARQETPKYSRKALARAARFALTLTTRRESFLPETAKAFREAGVVLIALPSLTKSPVCGATKRLAGKMLLMVSDRVRFVDAFWETLFLEINRALTGDFGLYREGDTQSEAVARADCCLIPNDRYQEFASGSDACTVESIQQFALEIGRDPGIVLARLIKDGKVHRSDRQLLDRLRKPFCIDEIVIHGS